MSTSDQLNALSGHHDPGSPTGGRPTRLWAANVVTVNPDGSIDCQPISSRATKAGVLIPGNYTPAVGDLVLVADLNGDPRTPVVIGALTAQAISPGGVASFDGRTGAVTLTKADVTGTGLAAVDVGALPAATIYVATFNGRSGTVALTKADVTGTGLAAADVGALPSSTTLVSTFNGRSGAVALSRADVTGTGLAASDVGALPSTDDLHAIAAANPTAGDVAMNSHKLTGLANGAAASDAAAFGQIPTSLPPNGAAGGDLSGTFPNPGVAQLQGRAVSASAPGTNQGLVWNGTTWVPAAIANSFNGRTGAVAPASGDYTAAQVTNAPDKSSASQQAFSGEIKAPDFTPSGLTGATAATRYVGGTASGAPTSGTFAVGDFVIDQTGAIWVCTTAGSPGTWTKVGGGGGGGSAVGASTNAPVFQGYNNANQAVTANTLYVAQVVIPAAVTIHGIQVVNGQGVAGNLLVSMYDSGGSRVAVSASTAMAGSNGMQQVPFTANYSAAAGVYYIGLQDSVSSTAKFAGPNIAFSPCAALAQGSFTAPASITPPTTIMSSQNPVFPLLSTY